MVGTTGMSVMLIARKLGYIAGIEELDFIATLSVEEVWFLIARRQCFPPIPFPHPLLSIAFRKC